MSTALNSTTTSDPVTTTTPLTTSTPITTAPTTTALPTTTAPTTTAVPTTTTPTTTAPTVAPTTSTVTAAAPDPTTNVITSVIVQTPSDGTTAPPQTVVVTEVSTPTPGTSASSSASSSSSTGLAGGSKGSSNGGGLQPAGRIAIAVVIPIVVVALLLFAGLFFWRRRKQKKSAEDERRKEMEAYGFNPNNDPTLPVVGSGGVTDSEMGEDHSSGYRGWGGGAMSSNRKASTTLSSGNGIANVSDGGGYAPGSPNANTEHSGDTLVAGAVGAAAGAGAAHHRHSTMDSETIGELGTGAPSVVGAKGVQRGPSNASSTYSMGAHSHHSAEAPIPVTSQEQYYSDYYQNGPYNNPYAAEQEAVIKDNPARRNTKIERAPTFPQQGSSGIAQNF